MKYRIEYRSSRREGGTEFRKGYIVQNSGGNFHEFDAIDDADAQTKAPAEWQKLLTERRKEGLLLTVGFVRLERAPDPTPVPLDWRPAAA